MSPLPSHKKEMYQKEEVPAVKFLRGVITRVKTKLIGGDDEGGGWIFGGEVR